HFQSRDVRVPDLEVLRVGSGQLLASPTREPDDHGHLHFATEHGVDLGRVVHDLVDRHEAEVERHDLDDRTEPEHGGADGSTHEAFLGDGCVYDALRAEVLQQPCCDLV